MLLILFYHCKLFFLEYAIVKIQEISIKIVFNHFNYQKYYYESIKILLNYSCSMELENLSYLIFSTDPILKVEF